MLPGATAEFISENSEYRGNWRNLRYMIKNQYTGASGDKKYGY